MRGIAKLLAAVFLVLTLGGCTSITDTEKLLRAPSSGGETGAVQKALNGFLGDSVQLKFPTGGEFQTPFLFGDWNGDGVEDAAVLYTLESLGQNVYLAILERDAANSWQVTALTEGLSNEVERVSFAAMQDSPATQILVGYGSSLTGRYLAVYSRNESGLETVLQQSYSQFLLADLTGSGCHDLILVLPESEDGNVELQVLTNVDGAFTLSQQMAVGHGLYTGCARLTAGYGRDKRPYLVVDATTGGTGNSLASTILIYDSDNQKLLTYQAPGVPDMYTATLRYNTNLLSADLDNNGTVEIPREISADDRIDETLSRRVAFLEWFDYTGEGGGNRRFGVWDMEYNFFLPLPPSMQGLVSLRWMPEGWLVENTEDGSVYLEVRVAGPNSSRGDYFRVANIGSQQIQYRLRVPYADLDVQSLAAGTVIF